MKLFTRIGSITLSLILLVGSVFMPAVMADDVNQAAMKSVDLFRSLGVIPDYYDYNIDLSQEMTRGDFVHAVYKLVGPEEYKNAQTYYYDVPETHWAYDAIGYLTEMGILHGSEEKIFEPDAPIEQAAAYKIMISILGYNEYAAYNGGYPAGYLKTANRLGISEGCSNNPTLNMADMLILLFQGATCGIFEPDSFGDNYNVYSISEDKTLFSVYKNLYYQRGIVEGANMTSITDIGLSRAEDVLIDGNLYKTEIDLYEYLGEEVEILYNYQKSVDKKTITWAYRTGTTDAVTVVADNDARFQAGSFTLEYLDANGQEKTLRLDSNIRMIYNGGTTSRGVAELLNMPRYEAKFVGKGNIYTIALVNIPEILVVGAVNETEEKVYDLVSPTLSKSLRADDYEYLNILLQGKESISFEDLSIGNVLSLYASEDGDRLEVHVGTSIVDGTVEQVKTKDYGTAYVVSGTEYYQPVTNKNSVFSPGDSVTMYLDVNGEIAYMKAGKGNGFAAFLIRAAQGDETFNKTLKVHLLGQDGIVATRDCQEKVVIDGIPYKDSQKAYRALCDASGAFLPQIALITYNSENQINSIDTPEVVPGESEYTISPNVPYKEDQVYKWFGQIGPMSPVDNSTIFFAVPNKEDIASAEDDDFTIIKRSDLVNDQKLSIETYKAVPKSEIEQYVVWKGYSNKEPRNADNPILVTGLGTMMDGEGNQVESLTGYAGSEEVMIPARDGYSLSALGIKEGDMVQVRKNVAGEIVNAIKIFNVDTMESTKDGSFSAAYRLFVGYVHDIVGSVIKIAETDPAVPTHITVGTGIPVLIYDATERKPIRVGTINDADTWYNAPGDPSRVVMFTKTASPQMMVIYK